jgi:hypothetical protein
MEFELEKEMLPPVMKWLDRRFEMTKTEFRIPWGYADIVACSLDENKIDARLSNYQRRSIGPQSRVEFLWSIVEKETGDTTTLTELKDKYQGILKEQEIINELECLKSRNFVEEVTSDSYCRINGWHPLHESLTAVELKLNDLTCALRQASANRQFADESYVALPRPRAEEISRSEKKKEFRKLGIGLLGISSNWCHTLISPKPKPASKKTVLESHCLERFWRSYIKN